MPNVFVDQQEKTVSNECHTLTTIRIHLALILLFTLKFYYFYKKLLKLDHVFNKTTQSAWQKQRNSTVVK